MPARIKKALSSKSVTQTDIVEATNREVVPVLAEARLAFNTLASGLGVLFTELPAAGSFDGQPALVSGRVTAGDGGGGTFIWHADSTTTADSGTVVGTAALGRWKRVYDGKTLEPAWFGAVGDDAANDTAAVQLAIVALANNQSINFGSKSYYLGARDGSTDAGLQLVLDGLTDKTLVASGATFRITTTSQVYGYSPVVFRVQDCSRVSFAGKFKFIDSKSWSLYASYGQGTTAVPATWSGFSGMYAIAMQERCTDISFGDMHFDSCRYGIGINYEASSPPTGTDRSTRISITSITSNDVEYTLGAFENGDDLTCASLVTVNCMRPYFCYGVTNHKVSATVVNSITGFKSSIARKQLDTSNIELDLRYRSPDGYPYTPIQISLEPVTGTGDPYIRGVRVRLTCELTTVDATRERQYACILHAQDTSAVETTFTANTPALIDGIVLDIDKGKFEHYVDCSPVGTYTVNKKLPVKLIPRSRVGGTYDVSIRGINSSLYPSAKKLQFDMPHVYEFVSSDTVHAATVVYPLSGWAPWKDTGLAEITVGTTTWRWVRVGAAVQYEAYIVCPAAASLPAGAWYFQMPYLPSLEGLANPPAHEFGHVRVLDSSTGDVYLGQLQFNGTSDYCRLVMRQSQIGGVFTAIGTLVAKTTPFAFDTGDTIRITVSYMAGVSF